MTPLPVDDSLLFKLIRIVNLTARPFNESIGKKHRLSINQWRTIAMLASQPGVTASIIAERTGLDKMSISRAVSGLLRDGRLEKQDDPHDQRRSRLFLTDEGQRLFAEIGGQAKTREAQLFAGASAEELRRLDVSLDRLLAALVRSEAE